MEQKSVKLNTKSLKRKLWWPYLEHDLQELLTESVLLLEESESWQKKFHDYSFIVFPAAKAYEGFLKKLFLDMGFINDDDYYGKRFRIGKSLNPSLDKEHQDEGWVYDDLTKFCNGKELPDQLWKAWKQCRNRLFHWFPNEQRAITHTEAKKRLTQVISAIDAVFAVCSVQLKK